jgi:hypothetical protein
MNTQGIMEDIRSLLNEGRPSAEAGWSPAVQLTAQRRPACRGR